MNGIEDTTVHDFRPTHEPKPEWLVDAEATELRTRLAYDQAIDRMIQAGAWDRDELDRLMREMCAAYEWARDCRATNAARRIPISEVYCLDNIVF